MSAIARFRGLGPLTRFFWGAVLVTLPVTSFRYFPGLGESTYIRPLAMYPLIPLLVVLAIRLAKKQLPSPWPGSLIALGLFVLALLGTSMISSLHAPLELRGQIWSGRVLRAWVTVAIGIAFFVAAIWSNHDKEDVKFSLRWLMIGFGVNLLWSGLQAITFYTPLLEKTVVTHWQLAFSMRELVKTNRISGLAYEPAWLAGQVATVYLPWIFAAVLTRTHLTRLRWLEWALLGLSVLLLLSTYSRGGLVTAFGAAAFTAVIAGGERIRRGLEWFLSGFRPGSQGTAEWLWATMLRLLVVAVIVLGAMGAIAYLGQKNYITRIWDTDAESLSEFIIENSAGARAAYAFGAFGAFERHPWAGVGLGASGFYIYDHLPDWALTVVPEIARQLSPTNRLYPNPKNMYLRILAESGLVGFACYLAFMAGLLGDSLAFLRKPGFSWYIGAVGVFSWTAVVAYNLTQDSFATPNLWINLGIIVGLSRAMLQTGNQREEGE